MDPSDQWTQFRTSIRSKTKTEVKRSLRQLRLVLKSNKSRMLCQHLAVYLPCSFRHTDSTFITNNRHEKGAAILSAHFAIKSLYIYFTQFFSSMVTIKL